MASPVQSPRQIPIELSDPSMPPLVSWPSPKAEETEAVDLPQSASHLAAEKLLKAAQHQQSSVENRVLEPWMEEFIRTMPPLQVDHNSNARPDEAVTTHMELLIDKIDWEKKILDASVQFDYHNKKGVNQIILDVQKLDIESISVNGEVLKSSEWKVEKSDANKPEKLSIAIPADKKLGIIKINYKTSPDSPGLYWRSPAETDGKVHPMLFTQAESTNASSFIPCQDSPQVKITFNARIHTGSEHLMAVGSSQSSALEKSKDGVYYFTMKNKVPVYLFGVAIADLGFEKLDERTGIYAEGANLNRCALKYKTLPDILNTAEKLLGPYLWSIYRPVFLTIAYPFGAMEHPGCSFFCLEMEDRIQVAMHELIHAWLGNLITNATWRQIFFNEGFTSHLEYRLSEHLCGKDYAMMNLYSNYTLTQGSLKNFMEKNLPDLTRLCQKDENADSDFSYVAYGKGQLFFMMLEEAMGRETFDKFVKDYCKVFAFGIMNDQRFLKFLELWLHHNKVTSDFNAFREKHLVDEWLYGAGADFPANCPKVESALVEKNKELAQKVARGEDVSEEVKDFDALRKCCFLQGIDEKISLENLIKLDKSLKLTAEERRYLVLKGWVPLVASVGYLTDETKALIQWYVVTRNHIPQSKKIATELMKSEEGKALVKKILEEGKTLDASVRDAIEAIYKKV